jgi:hypothetical protein
MFACHPAWIPSLLVPEVGVVQVGVMPALRQQPIRSWLPSSMMQVGPCFHHDDAVCGFDGGQAVGDQDAGRILQDQVQACWICHSVNGSMLAVASSRMKMAGRCTSTRISETSWRCPIERRLPRSPTSVYRPSGRVSSHSPSPMRFGPWRASRRRSLPAGVADVVRHRAREQERHLRDDPQLAAVLRQVEGADVVPVDRQLPDWNS